MNSEIILFIKRLSYNERDSDFEIDLESNDEGIGEWYKFEFERRAELKREIEDARQKLEELFKKEARLKSEIIRQSIYFHGNCDKEKEVIDRTNWCWSN